MATKDWSAAELATWEAEDELSIAVRRRDGTLRPPVPIWMVTAHDQLYVRTWHRRDTGWFGRVLRSGRARISAGDLVADVLVQDVGDHDPDVRAAVDQAYRTGYAHYGAGTVDRMVGDDAAAATLRLVRSTDDPEDDTMRPLATRE